MLKKSILIASLLYCLMCTVNITISISQTISKYHNFNDSALLYKQKQIINYFHDSNTVKLNPIYILKNESKLFKRHIIDSPTNISKNAEHDLWLSFSIDTTIDKDFIIRCLPLYDKVTLYYYDKDSLLHSATVGNEVDFSNWIIYSSMMAFHVPCKSINKYYLKFEINKYFPIAAYEIIDIKTFINYNTKNFIILTILITCLILISIISIFFALFNKDLRSIFYGLYVFFFACFTISSFNLWNLISNSIAFENRIYDYYVPFSLSTVCFSLYIYFTFKSNYKFKVSKALFVLIGIKLITIFPPVFNHLPEWITYQFLTKSDPIILLLGTILCYEGIRNNKQNNNYYLLVFVGSSLLTIAHFLHLYKLTDDWIFGFMFIEIIGFGILISISYKEEHKEKINTLNQLVDLKSNYNNQLKEEITLRTEEISQNLKTIDELNKILEKNNISLQHSVKNLEANRVLNKELSFEEFKIQFPDKETCQKLLANLKWGPQFVCNNCRNNEYFYLKKTDPYLRKCTKCNKIHSATTDTLFHNLKFPLEKAFYITFLVTSNKKYSVEKIGEMTEMRTATVWSFKKKVEAAIEEKKFYKNPTMTWQDLLV